MSPHRPDRGFRIEAGVAEFDAAGGHVQAAGIQLLGGWRALRAIDPEREVERIVDVPAQRRRQAGGAEVAVGPRCRAGVVDVDLVAVVARAEFQAQRVELPVPRSEEHTSELQSLMRISYAVFCLTKKKTY